MSGQELLKSREAVSMRDVGVQGGDISGDKQDIGGEGVEDNEEML